MSFVLIILLVVTILGDDPWEVKVMAFVFGWAVTALIFAGAS